MTETNFGGNNKKLTLSHWFYLLGSIEGEGVYDLSKKRTDVNSVFEKIKLGFQLFAALYGGVALNVQHVFYEIQH